MRLTIAFGFGIALLGCGADQAQQWVQGFNPPGAPDGFTRYVTPTVKGIQPGDNTEWCQWIAAPSDSAQDVLDLTGYQSATGHHAVLYATTETQFAVGESHICTVDDMISISFVGGVFGEGVGGNAAKLPDGRYVRLPAGKALMANTHWLNATDNVVDGQAVIDIKFAPASNERTAADLMANNADTMQIPPGKITAIDNTCTMKQDLKVVMIANHLHEHGSSIYTEIIRASSGNKEMLRNDPMWDPSWAFEPQYNRFSLDQPNVFHAGDQLHTHCEWNNTTDHMLTFPDEMCTAAAFYFPSQGQLVCEDGSWLK